MKHAKKYAEATKKIPPDTLYPADDTFKLVRETSATKFDTTVKVAMCLNVDPRKADQPIHGTVSLPHGTGKTMYALVLTVDEKATDTQAAGAGEVGDDKLIEKVSKGYTDFDVAMTISDLTGKVGRSGEVPGPRGSTPNLKIGTVTMDVVEAVKDTKDDCIEFRVGKHINLQLVVGKASFDVEKLAENYRAVFKEVIRLRPFIVKGHYIIKATVPTIMDPSVPLALAEKREAQGRPRIKA